MRQNKLSQEVAELAVKYRDRGVVGFDIAGPEDGCIAEFVGLRADFAGLRADVTVLTSSHKVVLWIGGGVATMCLSVFGLMVTTLWPSLK
jgi:hypothetical protein